MIFGGRNLRPPLHLIYPLFEKKYPVREKKFTDWSIWRLDDLAVFRFGDTMFDFRLLDFRCIYNLEFTSLNR
jgi:hypothetical protein